MIYLCSQKVLATHQTASYIKVCTLILEHPQACSKAQEMLGKKCKRLLAILQNQHHVKRDNKAKKFRFFVTKIQLAKDFPSLYKDGDCSGTERSVSS